jgi:hypothetical protein
VCSDLTTLYDSPSTFDQRIPFTEKEINKQPPTRRRLLRLTTKRHPAATASLGLACLALVSLPIADGPWDQASAQERPGFRQTAAPSATPQQGSLPQVQPAVRQPLRIGPDTTSTAVPRASSPREAQAPARQPARTTPETVSAASAAAAAYASIDSASPFGAALLSCDKGEGDPQFALPGRGGEIKLDRCYRGRRHLACRFDTVLAEGKSLTDEFTRIVEERYPEVSNVGEICKRSFESLVKDATGAAEFTKRFTATRSEYDARTACANKIKQSVQDVTLPDLIQASEVLKSMMDSIDLEVKRVSVVQEQVAELAQKMELAQRSIVVLQKISQAMCLQGKKQVQAEGPAASR